MQNLFLGDYPPIPECFSHLISQEREASSPPYQRRTWHNDQHIDATEPQCSYGQDGAVDQSDDAVHSTLNSDSHTEGSSLQGTFQKLNSSLGKLQREMVGFHDPIFFFKSKCKCVAIS